MNHPPTAVGGIEAYSSIHQGKLSLEAVHIYMYNGGVEFEWDPKKAEANRRRHGIAFLDATTVCDDDFAITLKDEHPDEERFIIVRMDAFGRILVVVYTWRDGNIRIISASKATARERKEHGES